jgi:NAD+ kinase
MRIGIVTKPGLTEATDTLRAIEDWLGERLVDTIWCPEAAVALGEGRTRTVVSLDDMPAAVDLVLVLGGDGTLLGMADRIATADQDIPILGVNFGSLGFLTEITRPELFSSLDAVVSGQATHDERMMLRSRITGEHERTFITLNDIVFSRPAGSRMVELSVWVGEQFVTTVKADGLIVASPTGSTAYNLSAGGPIVHPAMDAIVLTPIAPHTLSNRPIVIPAERDVRVQVARPDDSDGVYVTLDGQIGFAIGAHEAVTIGKAARPLRLVRASARSYFEVLREKLRWNER